MVSIEASLPMFPMPNMPRSATRRPGRRDELSVPLLPGISDREIGCRTRTAGKLIVISAFSTSPEEQSKRAEPLTPAASGDPAQGGNSTFWAMQFLRYAF
jgi:hypothetical protein